MERGWIEVYEELVKLLGDNREETLKRLSGTKEFNEPSEEPKTRFVEEAFGDYIKSQEVAEETRGSREDSFYEEAKSPQDRA